MATAIALDLVDVETAIADKIVVGGRNNAPCCDGGERAVATTTYRKIETFRQNATPTATAARNCARPPSERREMRSRVG